MGLKEFGEKLCAEVRGQDDDPVLLGYSMGGRLALHALQHDSAMWRKAVIVSAHPGLQDETERMMRMARDAEWAAMALQKEWPEFLKEWDAQAVLAGDVATDRSALRQRKTEVIRSMMEWTLGKQEDLRAAIEGYECPVTWVTGANDEKFTSLAEEVSVERKIVVPDVGHRVHLEAPGEIVAAVLEDN